MMTATSPAPNGSANALALQGAGWSTDTEIPRVANLPFPVTLKLDKPYSKNMSFFVYSADVAFQECTFKVEKDAKAAVVMARISEAQLAALVNKKTALINVIEMSDLHPATSALGATAQELTLNLTASVQVPSQECVMSGDPHIKPFYLEKSIFSYQGTGWHQAIKSDLIDVQVKFDWCYAGAQTACLAEIRASVGGEGYVINPTDNVNMTVVPIPRKENSSSDFINIQAPIEVLQHTGSDTDVRHIHFRVLNQTIMDLQLYRSKLVNYLPYIDAHFVVYSTAVTKDLNGLCGPFAAAIDQEIKSPSGHAVPWNLIHALPQGNLADSQKALDDAMIAYAKDWAISDALIIKESNAQSAVQLCPTPPPDAATVSEIPQGENNMPTYEQQVETIQIPPPPVVPAKSGFVTVDPDPFAALKVAGNLEVPKDNTVVKLAANSIQECNLSDQDRDKGYQTCLNLMQAIPGFTEDIELPIAFCKADVRLCLSPADAAQLYYAPYREQCYRNLEVQAQQDNQTALDAIEEYSLGPRDNCGPKCAVGACSYFGCTKCADDRMTGYDCNVPVSLAWFDLDVHFSFTAIRAAATPQQATSDSNVLTDNGNRDKDHNNTDDEDKDDKVEPDHGDERTAEVTVGQHGKETVTPAMAGRHDAPQPDISRISHVKGHNPRSNGALEYASAVPNGPNQRPNAPHRKHATNIAQVDVPEEDHEASSSTLNTEDSAPNAAISPYKDGGSRNKNAAASFKAYAQHKPSRLGSLSYSGGSKLVLPATFPDDTAEIPDVESCLASLSMKNKCIKLHHGAVLRCVVDIPVDQKEPQCG
ncbi:hypothetical protein RI367_006556 [Sorochytrium milnesiophthora]